MGKITKFASTKCYGNAEGPLGIPMRDDVAKEMEGVIKSLPEDCRTLLDASGGPLRFSKAAKVDADLETRTEVSHVTTESVDRDFEVIMSRGLDWKQWAKNPVVTFAHKYHDLPAGRGVWAKKHMDEKTGLRGFIAKTEYLDKPEGWEGQWMPDAYWHYVQSGFMPGKSIGFIPTEMRPPEEKEIRARPEMSGVGRVISKAIILEYALAPVQSNPDSIVQSVAKGFDVPETLLNEMGLVIPGMETEIKEVEPQPEPVNVVAEPERKAPRMPRVKVYSVAEVLSDLGAGALKGLQAVDTKQASREAMEQARGKV